MKKTLIFIMIMLMGLTACSSKPSVGSHNEAFSETLDQLIVDAFSPSDFSINFTFIEPENFGVIPKDYTLEFPSREVYEKEHQTLKKNVETLKSYKNHQLDPQQILDRDVLIASFEDMIALSSFYDYQVGSSVLGFQRALSGNIPAYLEKFEFHSERDVSAYLNFIETLDESFGLYLNFEKERQDNGTGFSKEEIVELSEQSLETAKDVQASDYFLIANFNAKIKNLNLSNESEYIERNKAALSQDFANAYQSIYDQLSGIDALSMKGLAQRPEGKAYYEKLIQSNTGSSRSMKEIKSLVERKQIEYITSIQNLVSSEEELQALSAIYEEGVFPNFANEDEMLAFLIEKTPKYFPEISPANYVVRKVDETMSDASSPAFYFTPQVDFNNDYQQYIYVNGDFDNKNYTTYAHEAFPGHMYQFNYFQTLNMHPIRQIYTSSANAEGWANYIEQYAQLMISTDETQHAFDTAYNNLMQILHVEMDIGINYDGWDLEMFNEYLLLNFGIEDQSVAEDIYLGFVHNPAAYPTYYLSSLYINDLKAKYLKDNPSFEAKDFNKEFLRYGSAPFDVIEKGFKDSPKTSK